MGIFANIDSSSLVNKSRNTILHVYGMQMEMVLENQQ